MGNSIIRGQGKSTIPPLLDETQIFTLWSIGDVRELWKRFQNQIYGFALVEAQFESIISFKENVAKHVNLEELFDILDNDHDGRIDGLEFLGGITLCCKATFDEKARFCFELFDFNLNAYMSKKELIIMMMSSVCGLNIMTGGGEELEPDIGVFEALADDAIKRADLNSDGQISFEEFLYWARTNRELMAGLETLNKIASDAKENIDTEDSAPETDDGDLSDLAEWTPDSPTERRMDKHKTRQTISGSKSSANIDTDLLLIAASGGDESMSSCQWLGQVNEPTNFKDRKRSDDGPDTNLELAWAFGYRAQNCRNNLRYVGTDDFTPCQVVYYTAALGVVFHLETRTQRFYMGHSEEITTLAMHHSQLIVATADISSNIHIWNTDTTGGSSTSFSALSILRGIGKHGIQHLAFSPQGDRIVSVGMDPEHTITIYDISSGAVISSAKGLASPNTVFDLAYSGSGTEIAIVGKNQVKFFKGVNTNKRALESHLGKIGNTGKRQAFLSVLYFKDDAIVGCGSGELYRFKDGQLIQIVQAHGAREPVLCLFYNKTDGTLLSGGKDGLVKTWDSSLTEVGAAIDLSEDVDGDGRADNGSLDCAIVSVQQSGDRILLGTRGSDMFEVRLPPSPAEHHALTRIGWGHASGELWGLSMHPTRGEFATCGGDKTMRIWSIRSHEQINMRQLPCDARTLCFSPNGDVLCIGMTDGSTALIDTSTSALRVYATWKHCSKAIADIKFSPDGRFLAVGAADCNIYLYKSEDQRSFVRQAVCKGHSGAVTHLDFSADSQNIQSNGTDYALLFWDMDGNQVKASSSLRDTAWATLTCTLGWPVQGIWPYTGCDYSAVNACMALEDLGDIVTGDDSHRVNLFRYPAVKHGALHQSYVGHASHVTNVSFSFNRRFVATLGGLDRTILLWRHNLEVAESDSEADGYSSASSSSAVSITGSQGLHLHVETKHEIADVGPRSAEQEAVNLGWSAQELRDFVNFHKSGREKSKSDKKGATKGTLLSTPPSQGDEVVEVKPWRSAIAEPTHWKPSSGCTDVDLSLQWVHGYRSFDCRNNLLYSAAGYIVYNTGALAVVHNKAAGKQQFLQGAHVDEVLGIAGHPAGQIFATGEAGRKPSIVIWNSKDMQVLSKIEGAHERGVPLLAFNNRGNILASVGLDADSSLTIHDWSKGIQVLRTATDKGKVLCMCFLANDSSTSIPMDGINASFDIVATGGEKHLKFWWSQGQNVQSQRALWGSEKKHTVLSIASTNKDMCVTGSSQGQLLIWKDFKMVTRVGRLDEKSTIQEYPHASAINAIWPIRGQVDTVDLLHDPRGCMDGYYQASRYLTGDKDGVVCIWRLVEVEVELGRGLRLVLMKTFSVTQLLPKSVDSGVRSLCERDGVILIGTRGSEIYEVSENTLPFVTRTNSAVLKSPSEAEGFNVAQHAMSIPSQRLGCGHFSGEVWGLAMHPFLPVFITAGDDCAVRCWHLPTNRLLSYFMLPDKCRAVDIRPFDGEDVALGLNSGTTWVVKTAAVLNPRSCKESVDSRLDGTEIVLEELHESPSSLLTKSDSTGSNMPRKSLSGSALPLLKVLELPAGPTQWSQVIKYSFDGSLLAAGSHDGTIYLYDVNKNYGAVLKLVGHAASVTHLDFGLLLRTTGSAPTSSSVVASTTVKDNEVYTDVYMVERVSDDQQRILVRTTQLIVTMNKTTGEVVNRSENVLQEVERPILTTDICIQSTSGDFDLLFWRGDGSKIASASSMKDAWWASFSCPLGWSVQGIWSDDPADTTSINAVARSHTWDKVPVLACVDVYGRLRLYNYPCVLPGASDKCYKGHSSNVRNIAFSFDDTFCVTVGGGDKGVFVWATDIQDEIRERAAYDAAARIGGTVVEYTDFSVTDGRGEIEGKESEEDEVSYTVFKSVAAGGDEAGAIKPWKGAIREPSDWKEPAELGNQPDANLELKFAYGYRGWDCRNNLSFADSRFEVVYHIAGVGVVFDTREQRQVHNTEHDDDILCLAVHPEGHTVATGEIGKLPKIVIWDANTGVTIRTIMYHKKGVANIAFSQDGSLLVSTGMDDERTVVVHNAHTGAVLGKGKAGKGVEVYSVTVGGGSTMLVTGGKNHVKFWELPKANLPGSELSSKAGIYNIKSVKARTVVSTAFLGMDAVTGMNDGSLLLWKDRSNTKVCQAHTGAITAMCSISDSGSGCGGTIDSRENGPRIISGGKDGWVHIWDLQLSKVWSLNMSETSPLSACPQVQALATKENRLLIGTKASEIYEVNMLNASETYRLVQGHFDERSEVWGLATHPSSHKFLTCGDDMTVRLWDGKTMQQIEIAHIGAKARAVVFRPDGSQIAVATFDGKVHILSSNLQTVVTTVTIACSWIQALSFSPDGGLLGVGSHDSVVYLLETKSYSCRFKFKGHHSYITALDFSMDGARLQSVSGDYELLFWDCNTGRQVLSATEMRDTRWARFTCTLGWPVQGIWPAGADGTDVNSVDRSPCGKYLVSGDDFRRVKLFRYPCPKEKSKYRECKGHAEHVTNVRFSFDSTYVYSVGGLDKSILQFEVKQMSIAGGYGVSSKLK